jgi:hypothetical protein
MSRLCICVCVWNFLLLYIFLWFFKNIYSISNFCKTIPLSLYDMPFGSNYHMVRRLEVLQCSNRCTARRLWTVRQRGYWSTCNRHVIRQLGSVCFRKIITFLYELEWRYTLYENYSFRRDLQLCSSNFLHLKSSSNSNNQYSIQISVFLSRSGMAFGHNRRIIWR